MSAISGILQLDASPAMPALIAGMLGMLGDRFSGSASVWAAGEVALGEGPSAAQPEGAREAGAAGGAPYLCIVADARIDNRAELGAMLGVPADCADERRLILAAYERWGARCAERLVGDFALAIWDARRRELFCARDAMGVKPFYYTQSAGRLAFASEAKALFALPGVSRDVNEESVIRFLGWMADDRAGTMYAAVRRLPAGHTMVASARAVRITRYWNPDDARDVRFARDEEYVDAFGQLFTTAVRCRLPGTSPVAAALSGGIDSSAIVCEARRQLRAQPDAGELHAISVIFPDAPERDRRRIDERDYQAHVIGQGGLRAHVVRGDALSPLTDVQRILERVDEPFFAPNLYLHWAMYGTAAHAGARVFLDGFDGDSAVGHGFGRFNALARADAWDRFETELRAFASNRGTSPVSVLPHVGFPYLEELARDGRGITWWLAAGQLRRRFQLSRRDLLVRQGLLPVVRRTRRALGGSSADTMHGLLRPATARRLAALVDRAETPTGALPERAAHIEALEQPAYQLALEIADKCAATFGVEARYPFFDRRLLEFCIGLPNEQKFAGGWPRLVLRRAMEGVLPPEIQWRSTKGDLSSNFRRRLLECDQSTLERADPGVLAPYVNVSRVRERLALYRESGGDTVSDAESCLLFRAAVLSTWFSGLRDRRSAPIAPDVGDPQTPVAA